MSQRSGANKSATFQTTRPAGVAPPQPGKTVGKGGSAMITMDELERIKGTISKTNEDPWTTMRNADRTKLQEISKTRIAHWPNTLEALRLKREEDRIKRLEDEEVRAPCYYCLDRTKRGRCKGARLLGRIASPAN